MSQAAKHVTSITPREPAAPVGRTWPVGAMAPAGTGVALPRPASGPLPIVYGHLAHGWNGGLGRQGALPRALAEHTRVILLDGLRGAATPGRPRAGVDATEGDFTADGRRGSRRPRLERLSENLLIVRNAMRLRTTRLGRRLPRVTGVIDGRWIARLLAEEGITDYVYWLTEPHPWMLAGLRTDRLVYDCIDPCFVESRQTQFDRDEAAIVARAKVVFATAHTLLERMRHLCGDRAHLLPNAASLDTHVAHRTPESQLPQTLQTRPRPIVGYMGTIDWRVDLRLLTVAATALPDCTFAIVGRVNADQEPRMAGLRKLPNVVVTGQVSYEAGHSYNGAFDVGLIPFLPGPMGDAINPVKMWMYLVSGTPAVAGALEEPRRQPPGMVYVAADDAAFIAAIRTAAHEAPDRAARRRDWALHNTWADRAGEALDVLERAGLTLSHAK